MTGKHLAGSTVLGSVMYYLCRCYVDIGEYILHMVAWVSHTKIQNLSWVSPNSPAQNNVQSQLFRILLPVFGINSKLKGRAISNSRRWIDIVQFFYTVRVVIAPCQEFRHLRRIEYSRELIRFENDPKVS